MRMFVAVWPDDSMRTQLERLELGSFQGVRLVEPQRWHVTLRFLGELGEDLVPALIDSLVNAAASVAGPVRCTIGPQTAWFANQRVLQIPVSGLDDVADVVRSATTSFIPEGRTDEPAFRGHVTMARTSRSPINRSARSALAGIPFSATSDIDSFDLVASQASTRGHRYTTVAHVPFRRRYSSP